MMNNQIYPCITGVAAWLPPDRLTNELLASMVDTSHEWIASRTGIEERRILKDKDLGTSYMASHAVMNLLEKKGMEADEVEVIICATITPDMMFPNTANLICDRIGARKALAFDMLSACAGFLYALETGCNYIRSGRYKKVIVVGADKMSSITDYEDRNSCILFGDAAAAVLLEPSPDEDGIIDTILRCDPVGKDLIYLKAGGSARPASLETVQNKEHFFYQDGKRVFKYAVQGMAAVSQEMMQKHHLTNEDIDYLIPHQANLRIIEATAQMTNIPLEKVTINIQKYGNTTAATIPLCIWEWENDFRKGQNILLAAFGAGFVWGATYLRWAYNPD